VGVSSYRKSENFRSNFKFAIHVHLCYFLKHKRNVPRHDLRELSSTSRTLTPFYFQLALKVRLVQFVSIYVMLLAYFFNLCFFVISAILGPPLAMSVHIVTA
jgi:hypothetical protein